MSSLVAVIILTFFWIALRPHHFLSIIINYGIEFLAILFGSAIFFNLLPDYISLLETRFIISQMKKIKVVWRQILFLIIDIGLTTIIFVIGLLVFFLILPFMLGNIPDPVEVQKRYEMLVKLLLAGLFMNSPSGKSESLMGVFFYSTFFTSVWVWLYIMSVMTVRVLNRTFKSVNVLKSWLDIDNQPIRVLGVIAIVVITVLFLVVSPFVLAI